MILITGANGFIGSRLVEAFDTLYMNVIPTTRQSCDLTDTRQVDELFDKYPIKHIIHCATKQGFFEYPNIIDTFRDNMRMYLNLIGRGAKFISFGSGAEFDHSKEIWNAKEGHLGNIPTNSYYDASKYVISKLIEESNDETNLRIFNVFGKGEKSNRFVTTMINKIKRGEEVSIKKDIFMDFFSIEDLITVVDEVIKYDTMPQEINLCYAKKYRLTQIADMIGKILDKPVIKKVGYIIGNNYTGDGSVLRDSGIYLQGLEKGLETFICQS